MKQSVTRPTKQELQAAFGATIPDVIAPGLKVLFVGINPSLYSGATGHHFARPGNRFWPALHGSGFTDRVLHPSERRELLARGLGVTNLVARATTAATELTDAEIRTSARRLRAKIGRYRPGWVAFLGIGAYRIAFREKRAAVGRQERNIGGSGVWVLPNPSGLNAHYQLPELARLFAELREAAG
jgi:double-stranded uracil-DNA glycosylase